MYDLILEANKEGKNVHLNHIEDMPFIGGVNATRDSIYFLTSITNMLSGTTPHKPTAITVKWDGAPAIVCGINPENGKFFVGTKGVFAGTPKLNYTDADIDKNHPNPGLNEKLKWALRYLKDLGFRPNRILQGDLMYTAPDLKTEVIDGEKCITFRPNTIRYAVPLASALGQKIKESKIGIIFHTEYKGDTIEGLKAQFNPNIGGLSQTKNVWFRDAEFTDASGRATFTAAETDEIKSMLTELGTNFRTADAYVMNKLSTNVELGIPLMTFINSKVRAGTRIDPTKFVGEFIQYMEEKWNNEILKLKKPEAKANREKAKAIVMAFFNENKQALRKLIEIHIQIGAIKEKIVAKLNSVRDIGTFLETSTGYQVTAPEGFVAINHNGDAVKLVDRLTFSQANFNAAKNWSK
jgi:hypothetical protein